MISGLEELAVRGEGEMQKNYSTIWLVLKQLKLLPKGQKQLTLIERIWGVFCESDHEWN